jgi:hypothetical protein
MLVSGKENHDNAHSFIGERIHRSVATPHCPKNTNNGLINKDMEHKDSIGT